MVLNGIIDRIVYKNPENGYTVLELETKEGLTTVVGTMPKIAEGEEIEVEGEFTTHNTFGKQFKVESFTSSLPVTETAMLRYLSSGIIKGIREATAKNIINRFGPESLDIIENHPERLTEIKGISPKKAATISQSMQENLGIKTILLYFQQFGMTPTMAFKIYKKWGLGAYEAVKNNPYSLCDIQGIGFSRADAIAKRMEYSADSPFRVEAGLLYILTHNLNANGHTFQPREKLVEVAKVLLGTDEDIINDILDKLIAEGKIVYKEKIGNTNGIYLTWVYLCEKDISDRIVLASKFSRPYDGDIIADIDRIQKTKGISFAERQKEAIRESLCHQIMVLTGGPGTGKTTTLNGIIANLESKGVTFALAAPTGRAAKRMTELTGKEAKTIHRLLEYGMGAGSAEPSFQRNRDNPLQQEVVIIDEASMVDLPLFDSLLKAIPLSSRLIMVGDANQLPPVGPGTVFKDIINSKLVKVVELNEIFRQSGESLIVTNAHKIIHGEFPVCTETKNDFFFMRADNARELTEKLVSLYTDRLPNAYDFEPLADIQIICPTKKTETGTMALNAHLKEAANPKSFNKDELTFREWVFRTGDKVMQIKNDYDIDVEKDNGDYDNGVFNGDIGIIERIDRDDGSVRVRYDDKTVLYTMENLDEIEPAYAITVHKSQGSEFKAVILPLLDGADVLFTRNLLYTAVTRAKNLLIVLGSPYRLKQMVDNVSGDKRYCGLKHMMLKAVEDE